MKCAHKISRESHRARHPGASILQVVEVAVVITAHQVVEVVEAEEVHILLREEVVAPDPEEVADPDKIR